MKSSLKQNRYIFSQKLAGILMMQGFYLKDMRPDKQHPERHVFIFNDSEELCKVLDNYDRKEVQNDIDRKNNNNT